MILADTSIWVAHLRKAEPRLTALLSQNLVSMHPHVVGEIACGGFANRRVILEFLRSLPHVQVAEDEEVLKFLEIHRAFGKGIGYVDAHILTAAAIHRQKVWTLDKRMTLIVAQTNLAYP